MGAAPAECSGKGWGKQQFYITAFLSARLGYWGPLAAGRGGPNSPNLIVNAETTRRGWEPTLASIYQAQTSTQPPYHWVAVVIRGLWRNRSLDEWECQGGINLSVFSNFCKRGLIFFRCHFFNRRTTCQKKVLFCFFLELGAVILDKIFKTLRSIFHLKWSHPSERKCLPYSS